MTLWRQKTRRQAERDRALRADYSAVWTGSHHEAADLLLRLACGTGGIPFHDLHGYDIDLILAAAQVHASLALTDPETKR